MHLQIGDLGCPPAPDVPAAAAACARAALEREGIAMYVALHDARPGRGTGLPAGPPADPGEAARLTELFDHYRAGLTAEDPPLPERLEPDETGARELIEVLVVLSDQHLRVRTARGATREATR